MARCTKKPITAAAAARFCVIAGAWRNAKYTIEPQISAMGMLWKIPRWTVRLCISRRKPYCTTAYPASATKITSEGVRFCTPIPCTTNAGIRILVSPNNISVGLLCGLSISGSKLLAKHNTPIATLSISDCPKKYAEAAPHATPATTPPVL